MRTFRICCLLAAAIVSLPLIGFGQTKVDQSVHNLSISGPGTVKSTTETGVCIFCHSPHNATPQAFLWNRQLAADPTKLYSSSTYKQTNNPISKRSKLCLSCHDGTIALGQTLANGNLNVPTPIRPQNIIGPDLSRDHPISFTLPAQDDGEIAAWLRQSPMVSPDPTVHLIDNKVECTTCHDPHTPDNDTVVKKFLVRSNQNAALCMNCHDVSRGILSGYTQSPHSLSTNAVGGAAALPYGTVAQNSCMSCHTTHNTAGTGAQLQRNIEENTCAVCHSSPSAVSQPAPPDVMTGLTTAQYKHPVMTVTGAHDPAEAIPFSGTRHSECQDCHNPHAAQPTSSSTVPPAIPGSLTGTSGFSTGQQATTPAAHEYEICFKCHSDSTNKPQASDTNLNAGAYGILPQRASEFVGAAPITTTRANTRIQFNSTTSFHPVTRPRNAGATVVPSLRTNMVDSGGAPMSRTLNHSSQINCSDCHGNDASRAALPGATGAVGPHSSGQIHILERTYAIEAYNPAFNNALAEGAPSGAAAATKFGACNKCHDVANVVYPGHNFSAGNGNKHQHINETACATCHDPHGSNNPALINFDTRIVQPSKSTGRLNYTRTATGGSCELSCHGRNHNGQDYVR